MRRVAIGFALAVVASVTAVRDADPAPAARWEIRVPDRLEVDVGATVQLPISIAVDRGLSVSKDGPLWIDVAPEQGLHVKKLRLSRRDAVDPGADLPRFEIPVRGVAAGDHPARLRIRLWLCGAKVCRPLDVQRQTTIAVRPKAGAGSGSDAGSASPRS